MSIEWARVMPTRHTVDEDAIAHYRALLEALVARGIRPMITVHHFSNPVWVDDPRDPMCANGPSDTNLCGFGHPISGPLVVAALAEFATLLGQRFGDLVDDWGTVNEPVNYLLASQGLGLFPPGKAKLFQLLDPQFIAGRPRRDLPAHADLIYHALKAADTVDADGDGVASSVGLPLSVIEWAPSRKRTQPSDNPDDVRRRGAHQMGLSLPLPEAARRRKLDSDLDGVLDERSSPVGGHARLARRAALLPRRRNGETAVLPSLNLRAVPQLRRSTIGVPAAARHHVLRAADAL